MPQALAIAATRARTSAGTGSMSRVNTSAMFCAIVAESSRTPRGLHDPEPIERGQPFVAVDDLGRGTAQHADLAVIRQAGAGDQVDEHFGRAGIEPGNRDALAGGNRELLQPQRPQALVALLDSGQLEDGTHRVNVRRPGVASPDAAPAGLAPRAREILVGQRRRSRPRAAAGRHALELAVKIRAAGDRQAERRRHRAVARLGNVVVIAMPGFDRGEAGAGKRRNLARPFQAAPDAPATRCRQRAAIVATASASDGPVRGDECRSAGGEPALESVLAVGGMAGGDERIGNRRAADASAIRRRTLDQRLRCRQRSRGRAAGRRFRARGRREPSAATRGSSVSRRVGGIEKVAEDVHVASALDRGDLDAVDEPEAGSAAPRPRFGQSGNGVVIGDADDADAGLRGAARRARPARAGRPRRSYGGADRSRGQAVAR